MVITTAIESCYVVIAIREAEAQCKAEQDGRKPPPPRSQRDRVTAPRALWVAVHAQAGYDLVVHSLDAVFSIAANDSCHPHHKNGQAWKNKGNTWRRPERPSG